MKDKYYIWRLSKEPNPYTMYRPLYARHLTHGLTGLEVEMPEQVLEMDVEDNDRMLALLDLQKAQDPNYQHKMDTFCRKASDKYFGSRVPIQICAHKTFAEACEYADRNVPVGYDKFSIAEDDKPVAYN